MAVTSRPLREQASSSPAAIHHNSLRAARNFVNVNCAATNGIFREDLCYRLTVVSIEMGPLRERKEDINARMLPGQLWRIGTASFEISSPRLFSSPAKRRRKNVAS